MAKQTMFVSVMVDIDVDCLSTLGQAREIRKRIEACNYHDASASIAFKVISVKDLNDHEIRLE
jgi:hypothetical protein